MKAAVHLVHPYAYKQIGAEFTPGPIAQYTKRDKVVTDFLRSALDHGHQVVHHRTWPPNTRDGMLHDIGFLGDEQWQVIFDERMGYAICTTPRGATLPRDKPDGMEDDRWDRLCAAYTRTDEFEEILRPRDASVFIGGYLEHCVVNAAGTYHAEIADENERVVIVPELCVSHDGTFDKLRPELARRGIEVSSLEGVLTLLDV